MQRLLALVVLMISSLARADGIVLEAYTGGKPADAKLLAPLLGELAARGFVGGYDGVGRKLEQVSQPATTPQGLPSKIADTVKAATTAWATGNANDAIKLLSPLVEAAHANAAAFAQNPTLRGQLYAALIVLGLSHGKTGDQDAMKQTFYEILRAFPEMNFPRETYGRDAFKKFDDVHQAILGTHGRLTIKVSDDNAVIYVDEKVDSQGSAAKEAIVPGEYRVFARLGKQLSRVHRVPVKANDTSQLIIDIGFDGAVRTSPEWTGLEFGTAADRERNEGLYAAQFANAIAANAVVVVGIDQVHGRPAVVGALINLVNGRDLKRASIPLEPEPQADRLRALARFLAGEEPSNGIEVITNGETDVRPTDPKPTVPVAHAVPPQPETPTSSTSERSPAWKWVAGGVGVAALATGGILLAYDGSCSSPPPQPMTPCAKQYNFTVPAVATLAGGAVVAGLALYLFVTDKPSSKTAYVAPAPGGAIAGYAGAF